MVNILGQLSVEPVFGWVVVIPLAVIMIASLWLTLTTQGVSIRGRLALMLLRLAAVLVLLLGWLRPGFVSTTERESAGAVAVLMDRSESMNLPSDASDRNRWDVQRDVWTAIESETKLAIGQTKLVPYFYDAKPVPVVAEDMPALKRAFEARPTGRFTDLGRALAEIGRLQIEPPLRGVILMGDAMQTVLPPEIDATIAARQMAQLDQPILMVGIGPRGEKSLIKDVAIDGMPEHFSAFIKKELTIRLDVNAQGVQNQSIKLQLKLRASGKPDQIVASREVLASRASENLPLEFRIVVPDEGEYLLEASASVDAKEQIESNNVAISFLTVREGGVKILYLEGQPRQEQLFLKRSLNESLDFDLKYALFPERLRKNWPIDMTKEINFREFDAIVLGDLDANVFTKSVAEGIARRVGEGAGLLILGGYHSFDAGSYGRSPLAPLFPVELSNRSQPFDVDVDPSFHVVGDIYLQPVRPHPITALLPEPDNTRKWKSLPPLQGMNRLGRLTSAPGIQVLLESTDSDPVLIASEYGRGRVLAFAGDTTWQWWLSGQKKIHQQFWRQAMLWLIRRDILNEGFRLELDRRRMLIDEVPDLGIEWFGGSTNKPIPEKVEIELSRDGRLLQKLSPTKTSDNLQVAKILGLDHAGLYQAKLTAVGADGKSYSAEIAFVVRDESRELSQPAADWQLMDNIVSANQAAGGKLFLPEEIGQALQWLRQRQDATKVTTIEKRRLGDAAWDAWLYLAIFCVLMSIEWGLRKSWQLP